MKKALFTFLLLPFAVTAMAQKLDIGAGGGVSKNMKPSFAKSDDKGGPLAPVIYAQASLKVLGFQFGLRGEYTKFVFRGDKADYPAYPVPAGEDYVDLVYGEQVFNIRAFLNKTFAVSRVEPYVGLNLGYSSAASSGGVKIKNNAYGLTDDVSGFTAGVQAGLTVFATSHLGINGQLGFDYYSLNPSDKLDPSGHLFSPSLTLGLRYRL